MAEEKKNETFDVVVVGAGMAGLTTALRLAQLGQKVALTDAWQIGGRTKSIAMENGDKVSVGGEHLFFNDYLFSLVCTVLVFFVCKREREVRGTEVFLSCFLLGFLTLVLTYICLS